MALPPKVVDAFERLAEQQRDKPERAMERVSAVHAGILNPVVMHTGDMIHRMTQQAGRGYAGYNEMREKVGKVLDYLKYGMFGKSFAEVHEQNIENNIGKLPSPLSRRAIKRSPNIPDEVYMFDPPLITDIDYMDRLADRLHKIGEEHSKLPAYNYVQRLARTAAIAVGNQDWRTLEKVLENLWSRLGSEEQWTFEAFKYELDQYGNPIAQ